MSKYIEEEKKKKNLSVDLAINTVVSIKLVFFYS